MVKIAENVKDVSWSLVSRGMGQIQTTMLGIFLPYFVFHKGFMHT